MIIFILDLVVKPYSNYSRLSMDGGIQQDNTTPDPLALHLSQETAHTKPDPLALHLSQESTHTKLTRVRSIRQDESYGGTCRHHFHRSASNQSTFSVHSLSSLGERISLGAQQIGSTLRESGIAIRETGARRLSESKSILGVGLGCIRQFSEDQFWFGEDACSEARAFVDSKDYFRPDTIDEEYDPRYPGAHLALPERKPHLVTAESRESCTEPETPGKSSPEGNDFTEFAKVVYRRLKMYRGIYIFYAIISFMLGLPVLVTGINKQFFSEAPHNKFLDCPHYLGTISVLSCLISLWTALKKQIVICVLTLLTGIITVVSAMVVLVSCALELSGTPIEEMTAPDEHVNQQTHVVYIFSIGLLIASLAIVITSISTLSARRVSQEESEESEKLAMPGVEECKESDTIPNDEISFASTISSLIKHELNENKGISSNSKNKLQKAMSCPTSAPKAGTSGAGYRASSYSLPTVLCECGEDSPEKKRRLSYLTQRYSPNISGTLKEEQVRGDTST